MFRYCETCGPSQRGKTEAGEVLFGEILAVGKLRARV